MTQTRSCCHSEVGRGRATTPPVHAAGDAATSRGRGRGRSWLSGLKFLDSVYLWEPRVGPSRREVVGLKHLQAVRSLTLHGRSRPTWLPLGMAAPGPPSENHVPLSPCLWHKTTENSFSHSLDAGNLNQGVGRPHSVQRLWKNPLLPGLPMQLWRLLGLPSPPLRSHGLLLVHWTSLLPSQEALAVGFRVPLGNPG